MFKDCEDCTRVSNNKFFNCPPRMADGRHFTDYRPRCYGQYITKIEENIPSSFDYRMYLTRNATEIMQKNAMAAYQANVCGPCMEPYDQGTMLPAQTVQTCNARTCTFKEADPAGLGIGRTYYDKNTQDEFRKEFIKQKEIESKHFQMKANCCTTAQEDLYYYPIDGVVKNDYERFSIPSGGVPLSGGDRLKTAL